MLIFLICKLPYPFCSSSVSTSKEHEQQLEHELKMAKQSAKAVIAELENDLKIVKKKVEKQATGKMNNRKILSMHALL